MKSILFSRSLICTQTSASNSATTHTRIIYAHTQSKQGIRRERHLIGVIVGDTLTELIYIPMHVTAADPIKGKGAPAFCRHSTDIRRTAAVRTFVVAPWTDAEAAVSIGGKVISGKRGMTSTQARTQMKQQN